MKRVYSISFFFFVTTINVAQSQPLNNPPVIEVFGNASIKVVPDRINFYVDIQTNTDVVVEAKNENDQALSSILSLLKDKGVASIDIQTGGIKVSKNNIQLYPHEKKYVVHNSVWFLLRKISKYDEIATELVKTDNVFLTNSTFEYSDAIQKRVEAREDALNAAKRKAEEMASVLGLTIGKAILITEASPGYYPNPFNASTLDYNDSGESVQNLKEGTIDISARVKVVFELIYKP